MFLLYPMPRRKSSFCDLQLEQRGHCVATKILLLGIWPCTEANIYYSAFERDSFFNAKFIFDNKVNQNWYRMWNNIVLEKIFKNFGQKLAHLSGTTTLSGNPKFWRNTWFKNQYFHIFLTKTSPIACMTTTCISCSMLLKYIYGFVGSASIQPSMSLCVPVVFLTAQV